MEIKLSKFSELVDQNNPSEVLKSVKNIFSYYYNQEDFIEIEKCYEKTKQLFDGEFPGYKACNTYYHDFFHTLDAFLATAILVDGYNIAEKLLPVKLVKNLFNAALLHDVGYIQENIDDEGTGAKYTQNHVLRSVVFLSKNFGLFGINHKDIIPISNIIKCTGLKNNIKDISFESEEENITGVILGTADILGQMSNREYLERLLFLYYEFKEAGIPGYKTEFDIIKNTLFFYKEIMHRIEIIYNSIYIYAVHHFEKRYNINENLFLTAINNNINYLKKIIEDDSTNFRKKLKRGNIEEKEKLLFGKV